MFKQLSSRASEAPIAAACIRAIAINIFNLHLVQAAPGEQPAQPLGESQASASVAHSPLHPAIQGQVLQITLSTRNPADQIQSRDPIPTLLPLQACSAAW